MATQNQIDANRRNSQKSTGPRSAEGKAASRFNALKSGIDAQAQVIPGENSDDLEALAANYHQQFQPATPLECSLVDSLIHAEWQLRRLRRVEAQLWKNEIADAERSFNGLKEDAPLGQAFDRGRESFTRLQRRIDATERSFHRTLTQLQRLRASADPEPLGPDPETPDPPAPPELASFLPTPTPPANNVPANRPMEPPGR